MTMDPAEYAARVREVRARLAGTMTDEVGTGSTDAVAAARSLAARRLRRRSGRLIADIEGTHTGGRWALRGGDGVPYLRIQEEGGAIHPRGRGPLTFKSERGWWTSTREVRITGRHFMRDAFVSTADAATERLDKRIGALLGGD